MIPKLPRFNGAKRKLAELDEDDLKTLRVVVLGDKSFGITGLVSRVARIEKLGWLLIVVTILHFAAEPPAPGSMLSTLTAGILKLLGGG